MKALRTHTLVALLLSFVVSFAPCAHVQAAAPDAAAVEKELRRLYAAWDEALVKVDLPVLERLYAADYLTTFYDGKVLTKAQTIDGLKSGDSVVSAAVSDEFKLTLSGDVAVVSVRWTAKETSKGRDDSGSSRWTDTWIKRDGRWQVLASHGSKIDDTEREVIDLERQISRAYLKRDVAFLEKIYASDFTLIQGNGKMNSRAQEIGALRRKEVTFEALDFTEPQVRRYGDTAVFTCLVTFAAKTKDGELRGTERWTDVLIRRDGRWQVVSSQGTPVPAAKPAQP